MLLTILLQKEEKGGSWNARREEDRGTREREKKEAAVRGLQGRVSQKNRGKFASKGERVLAFSSRRG